MSPAFLFRSLFLSDCRVFWVEKTEAKINCQLHTFYSRLAKIFLLACYIATSFFCKWSFTQHAAKFFILSNKPAKHAILELEKIASVCGTYVAYFASRSAVLKLWFATHWWVVGVISEGCCCCCCCWLPDPFQGMGAWRKTIEPQKPGNSPGSGPEVVNRQRVAKESAAQRVRSWTVQNEMRSVLGQVSAGAAGRILDFANPREVRT